MTVTNGRQDDVVVVGGGLAGLTAACYLARAGAAVTVLERSAKLGGRSATRELDGFLFNLGGHALYTGGATSQILDELGVAYNHGVPVDVFVLHDGGLSAFPTDPAGLIRADFLGARDELALLKLLATLAVADPRRLAGTSVQDWLDAKVRPPRLHALLTAFARTFVYSTALDLVSAEVFVDKFQRSLRHPVHYLDGGWQVLVDGLRGVAERAGARVLRAAPAQALELAGGRAAGVRLRDGSTLGAAAVVVATAPRDAGDLLRAAGHDVAASTLDGLVPARIACLDIALERLPVPQHPVVQDIGRPRFMSTQSAYARVAPDGAALVISFKQLDPRDASEPRADEHDLEGLLDEVQPGWRDLVVRRQFLPSIEAVGALPTAATRGFGGRPAVRVPDAAGVYLAGDWVGPEGYLIDASTASAREAARLVVADGFLGRPSAVAGGGPRRTVA